MSCAARPCRAGRDRILENEAPGPDLDVERLAALHEARNRGENRRPAGARAQPQFDDLHQRVTPALRFRQCLHHTVRRVNGFLHSVTILARQRFIHSTESHPQRTQQAKLVVHR
jgi:hypothetical protein